MSARSKPKQISLAEVKKHKTNNNVWIVINNDVLDVTKFLDEHPGGVESIMEMAGKDASQAFEDVGHSHDARALLQKYKIGWLPPGEATKMRESCNKWKWILLAVASAALAGIVYKKFYSA